MQFGSFVFSNNPKKISVSYSNRLVNQFHPFGGEKNQCLGKRLKKVTCNGVFFGEHWNVPQKELDRFLAVCADSQSQLLFVPGVTPFSAFLQQCVVDLVEDGRVVPYTLVFCEEGGELNA